MSTIEIQPSSDVLPVTSDDGVVCRRVATLEEYHECAVLQDEIWGPGFRELVPPAVLMVSQKMGGVCAAAFAPDGRMLGFVFGITGVRDGVIAHWSDMMAVRLDARGQHIGERLKHYQRQLCRSVGVRTMYWTFDPLVARNAHLNLMRLGARASEYVVNMYGTNTGSPLHGTLDTDRWIAAWDLDATPALPPLVRGGGEFVVRPNDDGTAPLPPVLTDAPVVQIAVPTDHEVLSIAQRAQWRAATRLAFQHYLERGYQVTAFQRAAHEQPAFYQMVRA